MENLQKDIDRIKEKARRENPIVVEYLEKLAERNWNAIQKFYHRTTRLLICLTVILLGLGILSVKLSSETHSLSQENSNRINEIRSSRISSVKISCEEQNERHKKAKIGLIQLVVKTSNKKLTLAEYKKQEILLEEFVQILVPAYNCAERVDKLTKP